MLESLHISNYALIDTVDITFSSGLNIITGETGAGKSIMLGALSLILGGRADTRVVRNRESKSVIEAIFTVRSGTDLEQYCHENDIEWEPDRCILRREITPQGRSRAFVNDSPVPLAKLESVASRLVDIHSQNQNQLLAQPDFQLGVIDVLADDHSLIEEYTGRYEALKRATKALRAARNTIEQARNDEDFLRYQLEQLDAADIQPDEYEELIRERDSVANAAELKTASVQAIRALTDGESNISDLLSTVRESLDLLSPILDPDSQLLSRLDALDVEIRDITDDLRHIEQTITGDPSELEAVESRLDTIRTLLHRHRVDTVQELISIRQSLHKRLSALDNADELLAEKKRDARRAMALARETAGKLTAARTEAARQLAQEWAERAIPLGMKNLRCEIKLEPTDLSATGADSITFLFAFNKNQPLTPVGGAASGGEISRLMLCLKSIVAEKMELPSIIFDEVDTGVSGDVARRMGRMMQTIGRTIQVIAITHLPQVAACGDSHYRVAKYDDADATHTRIVTLDDEQRLRELTTMLSGRPDDPAGRAAAESLLAENGPHRD